MKGPTRFIFGATIQDRAQFCGAIDEKIQKQEDIDVVAIVKKKRKKRTNLVKKSQSRRKHLTKKRPPIPKKEKKIVKAIVSEDVTISRPFCPSRSPGRGRRKRGEGQLSAAVVDRVSRRTKWNPSTIVGLLENDRDRRKRLLKTQRILARRARRPQNGHVLPDANRSAREMVRWQKMKWTPTRSVSRPMSAPMLRTHARKNLVRAPATERIRLEEKARFRFPNQYTKSYIRI